MSDRRVIRTITNHLGETVDITWTAEDYARVARDAGQETIELPADVAREIARLIRRPTRKSRPRKGGPTDTIVTTRRQSEGRGDERT